MEDLEFDKLKKRLEALVEKYKPLTSKFIDRYIVEKHSNELFSDLNSIKSALNYVNESVQEKFNESIETLNYLKDIRYISDGVDIFANMFKESLKVLMDMNNQIKERSEIASENIEDDIEK